MVWLPWTLILPSESKGDSSLDLRANIEYIFNQYFTFLVNKTDQRHSAVSAHLLDAS